MNTWSRYCVCSSLLAATLRYKIITFKIDRDHFAEKKASERTKGNGANLVEILRVGAAEQRLKDDDCFIKVPDEHSFYRVDR